jgi:hypothetical protein
MFDEHTGQFCKAKLSIARIVPNFSCFSSDEPSLSVHSDYSLNGVRITSLYLQCLKRSKAAAVVVGVIVPVKF